MIKVKINGQEPAPCSCNSIYFFNTERCKYLEDWEVEYLAVLDVLADMTFGEDHFLSPVFDALFESFSERYHLPEDAESIPKNHPLRSEWLQWIIDGLEEDTWLSDKVAETAQEWADESRLNGGL